MFCQKCGAKNDDNAKFCQKCGAALNQSSIPQNSSFFKNNKVLIIAIAVIICVCAVVGTLVYMNMNTGPQLSDYDISEFVEDDVYTVTLKDENGDPMKDKLIEFICYNNNGAGSVRIINYTDYNGQASFDLNFIADTYKIDVNYVEVDESIPKYTNITGFGKKITIKEGPFHEPRQEFINHFNDYVVRDANISVDPASYNSSTLTATDPKGNQYAWYSGAWFSFEDIGNGNVDIMWGFEEY